MMMLGEILAPLFLLGFALVVYVVLRIGRDRAVAERDAWRRRQQADHISTPAE